jgi:hypothetical protein
MRTLDHDIFPEDYIINILKENHQLVEGFVKGKRNFSSSKQLHTYS